MRAKIRKALERTGEAGTMFLGCSDAFSLILFTNLLGGNYLAPDPSCDKLRNQGFLVHGFSLWTIGCLRPRGGQI